MEAKDWLIGALGVGLGIIIAMGVAIIFGLSLGWSDEALGGMIGSFTAAVIGLCGVGYIEFAKIRRQKKQFREFFELVQVDLFELAKGAEFLSSGTKQTNPRSIRTVLSLTGQQFQDMPENTERLESLWSSKEVMDAELATEAIKTKRLMLSMEFMVKNVLDYFEKNRLIEWEAVEKEYADKLEVITVTSSLLLRDLLLISERVGQKYGSRVISYDEVVDANSGMRNAFVKDEYGMYS